VLTKNGQLCASGVGQTSRVDALKQAIAKAQHFGFDLRGAVMSSDAFFPFSDCIEIAAEAGITAVVQPGGSIRDQDSIDVCNKLNVSMAITNIRHFKH
jgi:phosphoribosylaminoimidazolecarboxamide formyltransferase/IMP cyclohydrolase